MLIVEKGSYFIQIARFDPSKGIPDVIKSYTEFHRLLQEEFPDRSQDDAPQLLMSLPLYTLPHLPHYQSTNSPSA
jgi:hypothetical protein